MGWSHRCYIPSFVEIGPPVLDKNIFSGFYHIWAWRPSWSCDLDFAIKLEMPLPKEASHKISTWSAKRFQRRRSLKLLTMTDGRRTQGHLTPQSMVKYRGILNSTEISWLSLLHGRMKKIWSKITKFMRGHHFPIISLRGFFQTLKGR